jgi:hypothetical protein
MVTGVLGATLALVALFGLLRVAKARAKPTVEGMKAVYTEAMRREVTDTSYLRRVADWLDKWGQSAMAGDLKSKIASIEASAPRSRA